MITDFIKLLKILEIDITKLHPIIKPTKFQNIILPDESFFNDEINGIRIFTNEYRETIERIRRYAQKNSTPLDKKKFYFSRSSGPNTIGEERLEKYFESKGYAVVVGHKLGLENELNVLANCDSFASTIGSCAHNMIFMKDNSEVILIPRSSHLTSYQEALNDVHDINVNYIDSSISLFQPKTGGPFCYIIGEHLKKFFGDEWTGEYEDEDFINFLLYVKSSLSGGLKPQEETLKYYAPILPDFTTQLKKREDLMKRVGIFLK